MGVNMGFESKILQNVELKDGSGSVNSTVQEFTEMIDFQRSTSDRTIISSKYGLYDTALVTELSWKGQSITRRQTENTGNPSLRKWKREAPKMLEIYMKLVLGQLEKPQIL